MRYIVELRGENPDNEIWEAQVALDATDVTAAIQKIGEEVDSTCMVVVAVNPDDAEEGDE